MLLVMREAAWRIFLYDLKKMEKKSTQVTAQEIICLSWGIIGVEKVKKGQWMRKLGNDNKME